MRLTIDHEAAEAPFEQLRRQIRDAALTGDLAAGSKLPTVRALAAELGLAANAYRELESDGVIETRGRNGSFVTFSADAAERSLQEAAAAFAARARALGVDRAAALDAASAALDA